jgi:uncharacterized protein
VAKFHKISPMPVSAKELYDWHARSAAFLRLAPPWEKVRVVAQEGEFGDGHKVTLRANIVGPIAKDWVAELFEVIPGEQFRDKQLSGPFASWVHTHRMIAEGKTSLLEDDIDYQLPLGWLGRTFGSGIARAKLVAMFAYRHWLTESDLRRHAMFADKKRLTVGITGASGLIGNALAYFLSAGGHKVVRFVRSEVKPAKFDDGTTSVRWNPQEPIPPKLLEGLDAVIHLAGDGIADGRWTKAKKDRIVNSRILPTRFLAQAVAESKVKVFLSGSAIGCYGDTGDDIVDESSPIGTGFLADVAREWEAATDVARVAGVRTVLLRTGIVQTPQAGALAKQLLPFRMGSGAVLGSGRQWVSWITLNDLLGAVNHALLTDSISGPVNLVAPNPVTNRVYGRVLAKVLQRPYLFTAPAPVLRMMFGEMADAALLASTRVLPKKLLDAGFVFDHPELEPALKNLLGR